MSDLAERIHKHQVRLQREAADRETERQAAERLSAQAQAQWPASYAALMQAVREANSEFEKSGLKNSFKYDPGSGLGIVAKGTLYHRGGRDGISATPITAELDGTVTIEGRPWHEMPGAHKYSMAELDQQRWANLLADIYDADTENS